MTLQDLLSFGDYIFSLTEERTERVSKNGKTNETSAKQRSTHKIFCEEQKRVFDEKSSARCKKTILVQEPMFALKTW